MTTQLEIPAQESRALAIPTPMNLIELAVKQGANADQLGKLLDLQLRWEANEQRKAYIAAMQQFKENPPEIKKTKKVQYKDVVYYHAELDNIVDIIGEALKKVGITHNWRTGERDGRLTVTCIFTHELGHSEEVSTLSGPPDTTGSKNNIQAIGSTVTYLQRYTLMAGAGLAAEGQDDDGKIEGMGGEDLESHLSKIKSAANIGNLHDAFKEAYGAAKALNDNVSMGTLISVYNDKKKELALFNQQ